MNGSAGANETSDVGPTPLTQVNSPGSSGGWRTFNGTNQHFTYADDAAFEIPSSGDWSVFAWFKTSATGKVQEIICKDTPASSREWELTVSAANTLNLVYSTTGSAISVLGHLDVVTDGTNQFVGFVYRRGIQRLELWHQGDLANSINSISAFATTSSIFTVGVRGDLNNATRMNGSIGPNGAFSTRFTPQLWNWMYNGGTPRTWSELSNVPDALLLHYGPHKMFCHFPAGLFDTVS